MAGKEKLGKYEIRRIVVAILLVAIVVSVSAFQAFRVTEISKETCLSTLKDYTNIEADRINSIFGGAFTSIDNLAKSLAKEPSLTTDRTIKSVTTNRAGAFKWPIHLYLPDGSGITEDGPTDSISNFVSYSEIVSPKPYLSRVKRDMVNAERADNSIIEYFSPVLSPEGEVLGMLSTIITLNELDDSISCTAYNGEAYLLLLDMRDGTYLMDTDHKTISRSTIDNFSDNISVTKKTYQEWGEELFSGMESTIAIKDYRTGGIKYFYNVPLSKCSPEYVDFIQVILAVDEEIAYATAKEVKVLTIIALSVEFFFILIALSVFLRDMNKQLAKEKENAQKASTNEIIDMVGALAQEYDQILLVDPVNGEFKVFLPGAFNEERDRELNMNGDNIYRQVLDLLPGVFEEDRETVKDFYTRDVFLKIAMTGEEREIEARWTVNGEYRWKYNKLVRMIDSFGKNYVVIGIKDTNEKHAELMRKEEAKAIISGLSREYHTIFHVYGADHSVRLYRSTGIKTIKSALRLWQDYPFYEKAMKVYVETKVHEDDRVRVLDATLYDRVMQEIPEIGSYVVTYRRYNDEGEIDYHQMCFTRSLGEEGKQDFILAFRDANKMMHDEKERAEALQNALKMADSANKAKTSFLSNMSHDIRTPMNAIVGFTGLAKLHMEDAALVRDYLDKIEQSSDHLLSLINDVLDMSRIESGKMSLLEGEESIFEILKGIEDLVSPNAMAKAMSFTVDASGINDPYVICDKLRLNQVLINLLSNSVKYTNAGGEITLVVNETKSFEDGYATYEFVVRDNGIGMTPEFLETIFEPFTRELSATASGIPGTGLGMAITKNIVDMMGGRIYVESKKGSGSEFRVILDLRIVDEGTYEKNAHGKIEIAEAKKDYHGKRILLVEDNELNREIACDILKDEGILVDSCEDGSQAVSKMMEAEEGYYLAILMDIQMPVMDGYEATKRIRRLNNPAALSVPIIAMTANAFEEDKRQALDAGMNEHISKPIKIEKLFEVLNKFM